MATNPAVSMPDANRVREALATCPFVVVSDVIEQTDTGAFAHVRLPAAAWGEKDGTVTNSDRTISRQRALFPLPGEARPDWWIMAQVAQRMGWKSAFAYDRPADIWREHVRLSHYGNGGQRMFALPGQGGGGNAGYDELAPFRILTGIEVDILEDGTLDQEEDLLAELDVVVASVHSKLRMPAQPMTDRMVAALRMLTSGEPESTGYVW
jgi:anaerobic selenocysteine-containing dehydrogenase